MDTKEKNRKAPSVKKPATRSAATKKAPPAKKAATSNKANRQRNQAPKPTPDVVYTQPGPFNTERFVLRLATVVAVVLALLFGMSIFFKVDDVEVSGVEKYSAWDVMDASGIQSGDSLLTLNKSRISSKIMSELPYVDSVRIGIKLPNTVKIEITELDVIYAVEAADNSWWLMRSDGVVLEKTNAADAERYTQVLGVKIAVPKVGDQAKAAPIVSDPAIEEGETVPITTVDESQRLDTAISILQYLEACGVFGDVSSVDVSDLGNIELWYSQRYQVTMGDTTKLKEKISMMKSAIDQMGDYQSGVLDVSFAIMPDKVIYTPFE